MHEPTVADVDAGVADLGRRRTGAAAAEEEHITRLQVDEEEALEQLDSYVSALSTIGVWLARSRSADTPGAAYSWVLISMFS